MNSPLRCFVRFLVILLLSTSYADADTTADSGQEASGLKDIDGAALFVDKCAMCHARPGPWPDIAGISKLSSEEIYRMISTGLMQELTHGLDHAEQQAIADYVGNLNPNKPSLDSGGLCTEVTSSGASAGENAGEWLGWSADSGNNRYIRGIDLSEEQVKGLTLKWAFVFPDTAPLTSAGAQPTVAGGRLYVGNMNGVVYALDAESGCTHWTFQARTHIRSSVVISGNTLVVADYETNIYALNATTGALRWTHQADHQPSSRVNGNITAHNGVVFVPVSSNQEFALSAQPDLACCTFQGVTVAYDIESGRRLWKSELISEPLRELGVNKRGAKRYGPSGAAVWSTPTVDVKRKLLYVTTSNQYTEPRIAESDALIALDLETGERRWEKSFVPEAFESGDIWNAGCELQAIFGAEEDDCPPTNPEREGDREIGSPAVLKTLADGRDVLLLGTKDGMMYMLDPDREGAVVWSVRLSKIEPGRGPILGGIEHGVAVDDKQIYVPVADMSPIEQFSYGNMFSLEPSTGKILWEQAAPTDSCEGKHFLCSNAYMAAPTVVDGYVFVPGSDGILRAFESGSGRIVWSYDTAREYVGVNGLKGSGGSINRNGPTIVGRMLYQNSGYGHLMAGIPGNVLLAFKIPR